MHRCFLALLTVCFVADAPAHSQSEAPSASAQANAPAPPLDACMAPGPYVVFFARGSAALTGEAQDVLNHFVAIYPICGSGAVDVSGHTDRSGAASFNRALSRRRAATVARYLIAQGIPGRAMTRGGFGSSQPFDRSPGQRRPSRDRRVEVVLGPNLGP